MICIYDNTIFYNIRCNAEEVVKCNMWDKIFLGSETSSNLKYEKKKSMVIGRYVERGRGESPFSRTSDQACREATLVHRRVQGG